MWRNFHELLMYFDDEDKKINKQLDQKLLFLSIL